MRGAAGTAWRLALLGSAIVVAGLAAVLAASVQGMALVPGGGLSDGYDVGLLPWMDVGTWLVPIGGVLAGVAAAAAVWLAASNGLVRMLTIPALLVIAFWALLAAIGMAPHTAVPDAPPSASGLQTVVYSRPLDTVLFLLVPAAVLVALAAVRRGRSTSAHARR